MAEGLDSAFPPIRGAATETVESTREGQLTAEAGAIAVLADDEARSLGHDYIATEHLLLAVLRDQDGLGARVLESLGVSYAKVRPIVDEIVVIGPREKPAPAQLPVTPRAQTVLESALREALAFGVDVSGEHVLLGIAREASCIAARILVVKFSVDEETLRREIMRELAPATEPPGRTSGRRSLRSLWRSPNR